MNVFGAFVIGDGARLGQRAVFVYDYGPLEIQGVDGDWVRPRRQDNAASGTTVRARIKGHFLFHVLEIAQEEVLRFAGQHEPTQILCALVEHEALVREVIPRCQLQKN